MHPVKFMISCALSSLEKELAAFECIIEVDDKLSDKFQYLAVFRWL